jgi:hypothetical protein
MRCLATVQNIVEETIMSHETSALIRELRIRSRRSDAIWLRSTIAAMTLPAPAYRKTQIIRQAVFAAHRAE